MKTKSILISNFKFNPTTQSNDTLQIDKFYNVNFNHGSIESELSCQNIFQKLFSNEEFQTLNNNNNDFLKTIVEIVPYDYFDDSLNQTGRRLFALDCNNNLYELNFENLIFELVYPFSKYPKIIYHKNSLYFFDINNCLVYNSNNIMQIEKLPNITTFAQYGSGLLFADSTNPYAIYKAETDELKNLSINLEQYEKFQINFEDGVICKIINLKDKLIAITTSAILKFDEDENVFKKQNDLKLNIYPNTIEHVDDNIYFYTSDGLYVYDGIDTERLSNKLCNISKNANSVCFNQNYYILSPNIDDFMFKFDFEKEYYLPLKLNNIKNLFTIFTSSNYELCVTTCNDNCFNIITLFSNIKENSNNQFIEFKPTLFGSGKLKQIKNIYFDFEGEFNFNIKSNLTQTSFTVNKNRYENLSIEGSVFKFEINSDKYFKINSMLIEYYEVGE